MTRVPTHRLSPATSATSTDTGDDWRHRAACLDHPEPDLWFTVGRDVIAELDKREAKKICATTCPVRTQCLNEALTNHIPYGTWGGLDEDERRDITQPASNVCGTGGGRTRHRRDGTPVCPTCLAYENQRRDTANRATWQALTPLLDRGHTLEEAAAELGIGPQTAHRARQAAQRQQRTNAA